eukprot:7391329-Prymnesium_polylepis.2
MAPRGAMAGAARATWAGTGARTRAAALRAQLAARGTGTRGRARRGRGARARRPPNDAPKQTHRGAIARAPRTRRARTIRGLGRAHWRGFEASP